MSSRVNTTLGLVHRFVGHYLIEFESKHQGSVGVVHRLLKIQWEYALVQLMVGCTRNGQKYVPTFSENSLRGISCSLNTG